MTIVVGVNPSSDARGALELGVTLARTLPEAGGPNVLVVATVLPHREPSERARAVAQDVLDEIADGLTVEHVRLQDRSVPRALAALAEQRGATALVLGSSSGGPAGRVVVGSTADYLLHSSPVPLAIAPSAYRSAAGPTGAQRLTCAFSGTDLGSAAVRWAARLTREIDVRLRICTFGVRAPTMYPPEIGTDIEAEVNEQWRAQMVEAQEALRARLAGELDDDAEMVVSTGTSWWEALTSVDWTPNELLILGSSNVGALRRVFLGSNGTKIIRHSPVPVLLVPHDEL
jgi:nucleotide-binding universal stress UspA family protein